VAFARLAADVENIGYDVLDLNSFPKNPKKSKWGGGCDSRAPNAC
jgi:hypothetical protein